MSYPVLIYMTAGTKDEALRIGRALVDERLAACVNILGGMTSLYHWEGKVQEDEEVAFLAKTRKNLVDDLIARVKDLHSYDCPCIVSLGIEEGNVDFLQWIQDQTSQFFPGHSLHTTRDEAELKRERQGFQPVEEPDRPEPPPHPEGEGR